MDFIISHFSGMRLSSQMAFLICLSAVVGYLVFKASHREENAIDWVDFITDPRNGNLSLSKLGHLTGIVISSWVIVSMSDDGKMTFDIFGLYLAFAGGTAGWSSYLKAKFPGANSQSAQVDDSADDDGVKPPSIHASAPIPSKK